MVTLVTRATPGTPASGTIKVNPEQSLWYNKAESRSLRENVMAVVIEWLACLPVTQKIGVRFYQERESTATSG